jgi:hypothetical protein
MRELCPSDDSSMKSRGLPPQHEATPSFTLVAIMRLRRILATLALHLEIRET